MEDYEKKKAPSLEEHSLGPFWSLRLMRKETTSKDE